MELNFRDKFLKTLIREIGKETKATLMTAVAETEEALEDNLTNLELCILFNNPRASIRLTGANAETLFEVFLRDLVQDEIGFAQSRAENGLACDAEENFKEEMNDMVEEFESLIALIKKATL